MSTNSDTITVPFTGEFMVPGSSGKWSEALHYARYRFASRYAAGKDVLDIACGLGYGSAALVEAGARLVDGVDIRPQNVAHARQTYSASNLRFLNGDITTYGDFGSYDLIVCFETIEHLSCYHAALRNCKRLLRSGGILLISSPNRVLSSPGKRWVTDTPENRFHVREFTASELLLILESAGFQVGAGDIFGQAYQLVPPGLLLTKTLRKCIVRPFGNTLVVPDRNTLWQPNYFVIRAMNGETASRSV
jgi:SAM-dependent methyltransferase